MGEPRRADDPLREQLLEAAIRVFARHGYSGAKILDIVREAGLSTGAVYGRFRSKEELLRAAVVAGTRHAGRAVDAPPRRVADLLTRLASMRRHPLTDDEAVRLEAYVAARREPEVAAAVVDARERWRRAVQPLVTAAVADGTVGVGVDPEAVLFFVQTMHLGLLLQRGAEVEAPDAASWNELIARVVASFGDGAAVEPAATAPAVEGPTAEPAWEGR